ncbi:endonuclease/exonuclease/phosphatase family protein [Chitinophaga defluvii]|uniref:Endonuclease/exonuclease/phosphatase family protein n=1 Tax=Chitinophaga defluvii TaxID=3163343 RepID=A0ABV2SZW4_9BACT
MHQFTISLLILLLGGHYVSAQQPVYQCTFEDQPAQVTAKGISGKALNLEASAPSRKIMQVPYALKGYKGSFTVMCWAKAAKTAQNSYAILEAVSGKEDTQKGWTIGLQANGAWYWKIMQGNQTYEYQPTVQRQSIKDDKWHLLAFSYDTAKMECSMYYDGQQVAIYYTPGISGVQEAATLDIGGRKQGDLEQWEAFNGCVDEVGLYQSALSAEQIQQACTKYMPTKKRPPLQAGNQLKVMNFNIYHGGNETGKEVGPQRVVDVIRQSGADIVSMQETYGSGAVIADALGYYFYLRGSNLSIMSKYPIVETLPGEHPFYNGGARIKLNAQKEIAFYTNWLNYPFDYWDMLEKGQSFSTDSMLQQMEAVNGSKLRQILDKISPVVDRADQLPVIFCGDFNSGSHLDWVESTRHLNGGHVAAFPAGKLMMAAGFKDSFREVHPDPLKERGITWTPQFPNAFQDRIDYIYYKGKLQPLQSFTITTHPAHYPSDHAALVTTFRIL